MGPWQIIQRQCAKPVRNERAFLNSRAARDTGEELSLTQLGGHTTPFADSGRATLARHSPERAAKHKTLPKKRGSRSKPAKAVAAAPHKERLLSP